MNKKYFPLICNSINSMSNDQLTTFYNLYSHFFSKSNRIKNPQLNRYHSIKNLLINKIKHHTPKTKYKNILNTIILIYSNYSYDQIYNILLELN